MSISLPLEAESVRCVDFALANHVDPGGTALAPDVVVLVEVPEPWPKPVAKHETLAELVSIAQRHPEQVRLLAAIPHDISAPRAISFRPTPTGMVRTERPLGMNPADALETVLMSEGGHQVEVTDGPQTMLVCTQGSHDICCGTDGEEFARWVASTRPDVELFRVSHTGGHRFSPTAMTLPDGRMWAYLNEVSASAVLDHDGDPALLAGICRGWWGAPTGPAQVAERALFAELGFDLDAMERTVVVTERNDGHDVTVTAGGHLYELAIVAGREVPTIACSAPGGQPIKPGREWSVVSGPTRIDLR